MADDVSVKFGASIGPLVEATNSVREKIEGLQHTVEHLGEMIGIGFTVEGVKEFILSMSELGEQTKRTAEILGITTEQVGQLDFVARSTGSTGEELRHTLEKMALALEKAGSGASPTAAALQAMGLHAKDLIGVPLPELLDKLRDSFAALPEGLHRTAIAQALVKGGAESLLPILTLSDAEYRKLQTTFQETGAAMSGPMAAGFAETHGRIVTLQTAITGFGERVFSVLKPAIDGAIDWITRLIESLDASHIAAGLSSLVDSITSVIVWITGVASDAFKLVEEMSIRAGYLATYGIDAFNSTNTAKMYADLDAMRLEVDYKFKSIEGDAKDFADRLKAIIHSGLGADVFGGSQPSDMVPFKPPSEGDFTPLKLGGAGGAKKEDPFQRALEEGQKQVALLQAQAAGFRMAAGDAAELEEHQRLLATAMAHGNVITNAQSIQLDELADKFGKNTAALKTLQTQQQAAATIADGFAGAVNSWLDGSKSIGQALLDLAAQFAAAIVQALIFDAIMMALGMPAGGGGGPFGAIVNTIIGGHAEGAWEIPRKELAVLHPGEMVLDAGNATRARDLFSGNTTGNGSAGGGGVAIGEVHVHHHGPGKLEPREVARAVDAALRDHWRPALAR